MPFLPIFLFHPSTNFIYSQCRYRYAPQLSAFRVAGIASFLFISFMHVELRV